MGPSGSGKSTLLSILGTLDEPTAGSVRLDGVDPFALPAAERPAFRNRAIGFVFQEHHLLDGCTALDNVVLPALAAGPRGRRLVDTRRADAARPRRARRPAAVTCPRNSPAASGSGWPWPGRFCSRRGSCSPTSRPGQLDAATAAAVTDLLVELAAETGGMLVVATHSDAARPPDRHGPPARLGPPRTERLVP